MFFDGFWMVGYAPSTVRAAKVMPIFFALDTITGSIFVSTARVSTIMSTFLHSLALQVPFLSVSYFEPFIAAFALATLPRSPGVLYGA